MYSFNQYISNLNTLFQTGNAREHSYRGDLQELLKAIIQDKKIIITNEPARIINVGALDYSITKNGIAYGSNTLTNKLSKKDIQIEKGKVSFKINEDLTMSNIPLITWEFYIGGYQSAQKWLKDRVGSELSRQDFKHYNKIINALTKTDNLMQKIDNIKI